MWQVLSQGINPLFQAKTNTNMILAKSVQITMDFFYIHVALLHKAFMH